MAADHLPDFCVVFMSARNLHRMFVSTHTGFNPGHSHISGHVGFSHTIPKFNDETLSVNVERVLSAAPHSRKNAHDLLATRAHPER